MKGTQLQLKKTLVRVQQGIRCPQLAKRVVSSEGPEAALELRQVFTRPHLFSDMASILYQDLGILTGWKVEAMTICLSHRGFPRQLAGSLKTRSTSIRQ